jgi:hypothetical protein
MQAELVFPKEFEYYCFKNCYHQLLRDYSVPHPVLYLDCGVDWLYENDAEQAHGYRFQTGDFFSSFLPSWTKQAHHYTDCTTGLSHDEIWEANVRKLREGIPLVVAADIYELDYTPFYQKKHSYHSLLLTGYDEAEDQFRLIDWYPTWFFKGSRGRVMLDPARSSANEADGILSGSPIRYLWVEVEREGWGCGPKPLVEEALSLCLSQFYTSPGGPESPRRGVYALHALLQRVEGMAGYPEGEQRKFLEDLHGQLFFTASRKSFLKYYLQTAADELRSVRIRSSLQSLEETIAEWKKCNSLVIKAALSENASQLRMVCDQLRRLIQLEKTFYYELYTCQKSLKAEEVPIWI